MCLTIVRSQPVYKFYSVEEDQNKKGYLRVCSPFKGSNRESLAHGVVIHSNRPSINLTREERKTGFIHKGIHVFLNERVTLIHARDQLPGEDFVIVQFEGKSTDLVMEGRFDYGAPSAVYTKLKMVKILKHRKNGKYIKLE